MLSEWICKWDQVLILRAWILFFINIASTTLSFSMHLLMRWLIWKRDLNLDLNQLLYNPKLTVSLFNSFLCKIYEENFLAIIFIIVWINNWFKNIKRVNYLSIKVGFWKFLARSPSLWFKIPNYFLSRHIMKLIFRFLSLSTNPRLS